MTTTDYFVYIAKARTGRFYVGITNSPDERIARHNTGQGSMFARQQGPFALAWLSEPMSKITAAKRERQIKRWTKAKKQNLIDGLWE